MYRSGVSNCRCYLYLQSPLSDEEQNEVDLGVIVRYREAKAIVARIHRPDQPAITYLSYPGEKLL